MSERRARVLLADDHPMMLAGLRELLGAHFDVVGTATNGRALVKAAQMLRPDLVIADVSMPEIDGIEATRQIRASLPATRVVILSVQAEPSWVRAAFEAGACGYLTKISAADEIEGAVREVLQGRFFVSPDVARTVVSLALESTTERHEPELGASDERLTPRELEIVRLVGAGLGNKEIAGRLGISVTTLRTHLSSVHRKLRTTSRVELALYAARAGAATT